MAKGRPREFDTDEALDRALLVFWSKGYEGASLPELTEAMGISRPSMYAAFGNKEELFRKALNRYSERKCGYIREALAAEKARDVFEKLLRSAADMLTDPKNPGGCLMVHGALKGAESCECIRAELAERRAAGEAAVRQRFEQAKAQGDLPAGASPTDLARYVSTVMHGMAVEAAGGASRRELRRVAETALKAWPD